MYTEHNIAHHLSTAIQSNSFRLDLEILDLKNNEDGKEYFVWICSKCNCYQASLVSTLIWSLVFFDSVFT